MQEPTRISILDVLLKSLAVANRKEFIHRLIYIVKYNERGVSDTSCWLPLIKGNLRSLADDRMDDSLSGIGLFFPGLLINILEGSQDLLDKHMLRVMNFIRENKQDDKVKILVMVPHIIKRYFVSWTSVNAKFPVLLEAMPLSKGIQEHAAKAKECILQMYKLSEYLSQQSETHYQAAVTELSKTSKQLLPQADLLELLLDSPLLLAGEDYGLWSKPLHQLYHEQVWPVPPDFIPENVLFNHST